MSLKPSSSTSSIQAPRIVVLGSLNMDLVLRVPHAPAAGETLLGHSIANIPGGKGANQAVSCAREGAQVQMIGCVGDDAHGQSLRQALERDGIDTAALRTVAGEPTGTALILVEDSGQNRIVMIPGANARVEIDEAALKQQVQGRGLPRDAVRDADGPGRARHCGGAWCGLQGAAQPVAGAGDRRTAVAADRHAGRQRDRGADAVRPVRRQSAGKRPRPSQALRAKGIARVVVTLGARGAVAVDADGARHHPAPKVQAVDTTAAGDTFLGALAVALGEGQPFDEAVRLGIRAAALLHPAARRPTFHSAARRRAAQPPASRLDQAVKRSPCCMPNCPM